MHIKFWMMYGMVVEFKLDIQMRYGTILMKTKRSGTMGGSWKLGYWGPESHLASFIWSDLMSGGDE